MMADEGTRLPDWEWTPAGRMSGDAFLFLSRSFFLLLFLRETPFYIRRRRRSAMDGGNAAHSLIICVGGGEKESLLNVSFSRTMQTDHEFEVSP